MKNKILTLLIIVSLFIVVGFTYNHELSKNILKVSDIQAHKKIDNISNLISPIILGEPTTYKFTGYNAGYLLWIIPSEINIDPLVEVERDAKWK